ncbi:ATP-binding cassette domain-containing protein [Streptomyces sp. R-74717]|uniref:ATP-binding cassette domain-containing protein n=1 Tax=Streptomyces atratus TaxID=1893 RepID=UPI0037AFBC30
MRPRRRVRSGRSTVGRCVVRLDEPTGGTVHINGTDVTHLSRRALRPLRKDFHLVFQDPSSSLDPRMTIGQIIAEPIKLHRQARGEAVRARVEQLLAQGHAPGLIQSLGDQACVRHPGRGARWAPHSPEVRYWTMTAHRVSLIPVLMRSSAVQNVCD